MVKERSLDLRLDENIENPFVFCDPRQTTQALNNLLDNAIYYTKKGSITVSFEDIDEDFLKIYIKDTGSGIPKDEWKKIFEKFSRGKRAIEYRPGGSGLGLYISQKIVEAGGGELKLEKSELDKGSVFSVTIPMYPKRKK